MPTFSNYAAVQAGVREVLKYDPNKAPSMETSAMLWDSLMKGEASEINSRNAFLIKEVDNAAVIRADATEFADYAPPSNNQDLKLSIPITRATKSYAVSGAVKRQNQTGTMLLNSIIRGCADVKRMFGKQMNFHCHGNATGEIAKASGVSSLVVTCNSTTNLFGTRHVFKNEYLEYRASGVLRTGGGISYSKVTAVDRAAKTFTVDAIPSDATTNDLIFDQGSYNNWLRGLGYHVNNTGAWQGVSDRTAYIGLSSVLVSLSGAYLSRAALDLIIGELSYKFGDDESMGEMMAYMSPAQVAFFKALGYDLQRYDGASKSLQTGFLSDALQHGNLMIKGSVDQPHDIIYVGKILNLMMRFETIEPQWHSEPGTTGDEYLVWANAAQGQFKADGYFATFEWEGNTGVYQPDHVGALTSVGYAGGPLGNSN